MGNQLLEVATKDTSLWVAAEALDAIFDSFGDGVTADRVAIELGLTSRLKAMVPQLKSKVQDTLYFFNSYFSFRELILTRDHNVMLASLKSKPGIGGLCLNYNFVTFYVNWA